jgi:hypothetical protein
MQTFSSSIEFVQVDAGTVDAHRRATAAIVPPGPWEGNLVYPLVPGCDGLVIVT